VLLPSRNPDRNDQNKNSTSWVQAHAEQLAEQSKVATSQPQAVQVAVQAQSFQAKAQSLEKAAEAQDLQVRTEEDLIFSTGGGL
jgi:hypothetical protein